MIARSHSWLVALAVAVATVGLCSRVALADSSDDELKALTEQVRALVAGAAVADTPRVEGAPGEIKDLRAQVNAINSTAFNAVLAEQLNLILKRLDEIEKKQAALQAAGQEVKPAAAPEAKPKPAADPLKDILKGFYGTMDVSFDDTTKGISNLIATQYALANAPPVIPSGTNPPTLGPGDLVSSVHTPPVGRVGWMPALSTNKSAFGYRGDVKIGESSTKLTYQVEVGLAITSSPGLNTSYTQQANLTKTGIGAGDTFVGFKGPWGALKFGTTYAPYKKSTDRLNPFSGQLGDYAVMIGNTGGDNRVEFGTRLDHSLWYESPKFGGGFGVDVLFSPGQNRTFDNVIQSAGSPDCNGGNEPGSGNLPLNCDDGGFGDAFSADFKYEHGGFYGVVAYEWHKDVNRNSDGIGSNNYQYGIFAANNPDLVINSNNNPAGLPPQALGAYTTSIGNEWAFKAGLQYKFDFKLTLSGLWEKTKRDIPDYLAYQNERTRDSAFWAAATQEFGKNDTISLGFGHAGKTPGDPGGQHNYNPFAPADTANLYTVAFRHKLDKAITLYADYADTVNHGNVHYDLGAGGRGLTTDCHDGTNTVFVDYSSSGPTTWGGCHIQGFSAGLNYRF